MRALAAVLLVLVAIPSPVRAQEDTEVWSLLGSNRIDLVDGKSGAKVLLANVTHLEVLEHDGKLATRINVTHINGRDFVLRAPRIRMAAGWDHPTKDYPRDDRGRTVLRLHATASLDSLETFLHRGDATLRWREVSRSRLVEAAMKRLDRARTDLVNRANEGPVSAEDLEALRAAVNHARQFAFDDDTTWDHFDDVEIALATLEARVRPDDPDAEPVYEPEPEPEVEPTPEPETSRRVSPRSLDPRAELLDAQRDLIALLRAREASPADVAVAADRYRFAGGRTSALRKIDRKAATRLRQLNLVHQRALARRAYTPIPDALRPFIARDLTQLAADGKLEEIIGRKAEVRRVLQGLNRRTKPNVFLTGEPGVGKTALVEALAIKSARGDLDVPDSLRGKPILELALGNLVAGTVYRGQLEERVQQMMTALLSIPKEERPILFIDEGHTLVGGGAAEGGLDIGNMLKPALARGDLQVISATTSDEYKRFVERDKALGRRFGPVYVAEPSPALALRMLRTRVAANERRYKLKIDHGALKAAVDLSVRYLPSRALPDKSQDVLEEAASRANARRATRVTEADVRAVIAEWSNMTIRTGRAESEMLLHLDKRLGKRVFGQDEAVEELSDAYVELRAKMKVGKNRRPANLMFLGPTGVGKTELAKAFAEDVFGSEDAMTRIDMSEFRAGNSVNRLIGSPNGYVDSSEEGLLTKAVRRRPFQVLVLDEIEKAHEDVQNLLLQILEDGRLTDRYGTVDFSNVVIIMTSNALTETPKARQEIGFGRTTAGDDAAPDADKKTLRAALVRAGLRPELVNRIDRPVLFKPLSRPALGSIVRKMVAAEGADYGVSLKPTAAAEEEILRRGYNPSMGARPLRRAVQKVAKPLARAVVGGPAAREYLVDAKGRELTVSATGARPAARPARINPKLKKRLQARRAGR